MLRCTAQFAPRTALPVLVATVQGGTGKSLEKKDNDGEQLGNQI